MAAGGRRGQEGERGDKQPALEECSPNARLWWWECDEETEAQRDCSPSPGLHSTLVVG